MTPKDKPSTKLTRFRVYGVVVGTKYLGVFEAATQKEAEEKALNSDNACVSLCHQCCEEC